MYTCNLYAYVTTFNIKPAITPGENFASAVFRVSIKYKILNQVDEHEMSMIVKTLPVSVDLPNMQHMNDSTLFQNEVTSYIKVLNNIQKLIQSAGYPDEMCPNLIHNTLTPMPIIKLEDVSSIGFDTMIKKPHDDFEASKMIVKRLAKFHAASFYLYDKKSIEVDTFNTCIYKMDNVEKMFDKSLDILLNLLTQWGGYERYINPIKHFRSTYIKKARKCYLPTIGAFNVLTHGDFHPKNVLYKINENGTSIDDFIMIDFQICCYASPAIDLTYVLYTFVSDENRLTRYDELLAIYHEHFVKVLLKIGYNGPLPTLLDLHIEMLKNGFMEPVIFLLIFPLVFLDLTEVSDADYIDIMKMMKVKSYENKQFRDILEKYLERFMNKGFLI